jgi:hypothetical protein
MIVHTYLYQVVSHGDGISSYPDLHEITLRPFLPSISDLITRRDAGTVVEMVIAGDFNRHDQLWGGDEVSMERQGEADPIIDMMNELALSSLLRRGTKTWHGGREE